MFYFSSILVKYTIPAGIAVVWCAWPAMSDEYKEATFGVKPKDLSNMVVPKADAPGGTVQRFVTGGGQYAFEKTAVGERPNLKS